MTEGFITKQASLHKKRIKQVEAEKLKKRQAPLDPEKIKKIENEKKKGMKC